MMMMVMVMMMMMMVMDGYGAWVRGTTSAAPHFRGCPRIVLLKDANV